MCEVVTFSKCICIDGLHALREVDALQIIALTECECTHLTYGAIESDDALAIQITIRENCEPLESSILGNHNFAVVGCVPNLVVGLFCLRAPHSLDGVLCFG